MQGLYFILLKQKIIEKQPWNTLFILTETLKNVQQNVSVFPIRK